MAATTRCVDSGWPNDPPSARHVGVLVGNRSPVRLNSAAPALWPPVLWLSKDPIGGRQTISAPAALLSLGVLPLSVEPATWPAHDLASAPRSMWLPGTNGLGKSSRIRSPFAHVERPRLTDIIAMGTLSTTSPATWSGDAVAATWPRTAGSTHSVNATRPAVCIPTISARAAEPSSSPTARAPASSDGALTVDARSVLITRAEPR